MQKQAVKISKQFVKLPKVGLVDITQNVPKIDYDPVPDDGTGHGLTAGYFEVPAMVAFPVGGITVQKETQAYD